MFNKEEPLWLPRGSVRAIIALIVIVAFTANYLWIDLDDFPLEIVTLVLGFYFGTRAKAKDNGEVEPEPLTEE